MKLFVPKSYGYGAVPKGWGGWAVLALWVAAISGLAWLMIERPTQADPPGEPMVLAYVAIVAVLTIAFVLFARATTDGEWRWRRGGD